MSIIFQIHSLPLTALGTLPAFTRSAMPIPMIAPTHFFTPNSIQLAWTPLARRWGSEGVRNATFSGKGGVPQSPGGGNTPVAPGGSSPPGGSQGAGKPPTPITWEQVDARIAIFRGRRFSDAHMKCLVEIAASDRKFYSPGHIMKQLDFLEAVVDGTTPYRAFRQLQERQHRAITFFRDADFFTQSTTARRYLEIMAKREKGTVSLATYQHLDELNAQWQALAVVPDPHAKHYMRAASEIWQDAVRSFPHPFASLSADWCLRSLRGEKISGVGGDGRNPDMAYEGSIFDQTPHERS